MLQIQSRQLFKGGKSFEIVHKRECKLLFTVRLGIHRHSFDFNSKEAKMLSEECNKQAIKKGTDHIRSTKI